jgi:putative transposase
MGFSPGPLRYPDRMRRAPQETRTYLLTLVTAQRRRILQVANTAHMMVEHLQEQRRKRRLGLHAFVVMPDHLHLLLTPAEDVSLEKTVQYIKGGFSFLLKSKLDVWERGYNEVQVKTHEQFTAFRTYIEENPVRAHLVAAAGEYPHSSISQPGSVDPRPFWLTMHGTARG